MNDARTQPGNAICRSGRIITGGTMTPLQKLEIGIFAVTLFLGAVAVWRASEYPRDLARRVRLRVVGIVLGMSLLPVGVFLMDAISTGLWLVLVVVLSGGGLFLVHASSRKGLNRER